MRLTRIIFFITVLLATMVSCIKEYTPVINAGDEKKLVISGSVLDNRDIQTINVSRTSPINAPDYYPIIGCQVTVTDGSGNSFNYTDMENGNYTCHIEPDYLRAGTKWKVNVITPEGEVIESDEEEITSNSVIDSVYYKLEDIESSIPGVVTKGIRFMVNLDNANSDSRYYKWELTETWEHRADYPVIWYYDGEVHKVWPPDSTNMYCWSTEIVPYLYTVTTEQLNENKYKELPLHFVNNVTTKLVYGYSLLTTQYSLTKEAYNYWDQLKANSQEQGGLYNKQPIAIKGNLHNRTHPEEDVLGFFYASSVKEKRIFVHDVPNLELEFISICNTNVLRVGLRELGPRDYPAYLLGDEFGWAPVVMDLLCVDCTAAGGTNVKPDFWPR